MPKHLITVHVRAVVLLSNRSQRSAPTDGSRLFLNPAAPRRLQGKQCSRYSQGCPNSAHPFWLCVLADLVLVRQRLHPGRRPVRRARQLATVRLSSGYERYVGSGVRGRLSLVVDLVFARRSPCHHRRTGRPRVPNLCRQAGLVPHRPPPSQHARRARSRVQGRRRVGRRRR